MIEVVEAQGASELDVVRELFREYAAQVAELCCFAGFEREVAGLPGEYAPPAGGLWLAREGGAAAGCVALRRLDADSGEMKRLYVRETFRGRGLGRRLAELVVEETRKRACTRLVLDTLPKMREAIVLYESLGFRETGPYSRDPTPGARFFELRIS
jgi:ribosomal protein S18 acetylase RimI-like enzyme